MTNQILSVNSLSWSVGDHDILKSLNFTINGGEFVGLIGPNGAGKSSLMRCCYRSIKPSSGNIHLLGEDVWQHSLQRNAQNVSVILQEHSDHSGLTVFDVVSQGHTPHKGLFAWDSREDKALVSKTLEQLDLIALKDSEYRHLSGGEKQRVMLARAIVQKPKLLVMDEPTNHLDVHYQIDLMRMVKKMSVTVLASFHDLNLAAAYCSRLLVLDQGEIVADGTPESVLSESLLKKTFKADACLSKCPDSGRVSVFYVY